MIFTTHFSKNLSNTSWNLLGLLSKYHFVHFSAITNISISAQLCIWVLSTSDRQIIFSRICSNRSSKYVPPSPVLYVLPVQSLMVNRKFVLGHCSTHTVVVESPIVGWIGILSHFTKSKISKYSLSSTSLSTPHFRPFDSVGATTSLSPLWPNAVNEVLIFSHLFFHYNELLTVVGDESPTNKKS